MVAHASSLGIWSLTFVSKRMTKNLDPENTLSNALSSVTMLRVGLFYTYQVYLERMSNPPTTSALIVANIWEKEAFPLLLGKFSIGTDRLNRRKDAHSDVHGSIYKV